VSVRMTGFFSPDVEPCRSGHLSNYIDVMADKEDRVSPRSSTDRSIAQKTTMLSPAVISPPSSSSTPPQILPAMRWPRGEAATGLLAARKLMRKRLTIRPQSNPLAHSSPLCPSARPDPVLRMPHQSAAVDGAIRRGGNSAVVRRRWILKDNLIILFRNGDR